MKNLIIQINVKEKTYRKLVDHGFWLEKNINDYLDAIAKEIIENEQEETKKSNLYEDLMKATK